MATKTWNPTSGNLASTGANWGGSAPVSGDNVVFDATSTADCTWNLTSSVNTASINVSSAYTGTITVAASSRIRCSGTFTFDGGTLDINGAESGIAIYVLTFDASGSGTKTINAGTGSEKWQTGSIDFSGSNLTWNQETSLIHFGVLSTTANMKSKSGLQFYDFGIESTVTRNYTMSSDIEVSHTFWSNYTGNSEVNLNALSGGPYHVYIYGDYNTIGSGEIKGDAIFEFTGTAAQTWYGGNRLYNSVVINKSSNTLTLNDGLSIITKYGGSLTHTNGTISYGTTTFALRTGTSTGVTVATNGMQFFNLNLIGGTHTLNNNITVNGFLDVQYTSNSSTTINGNKILVIGGLKKTGSTSQNITGTTTIEMSGSGSQNFDLSPGTGYCALPIIFNTSGTVTFVAGTHRISSNTVTYTAGTVDTTTNNSTLSIVGSVNLNTNGLTWDNISMGANITLLSNLTLAGNWTKTSGTLSGNYAVIFNGTCTLSGSTDFYSLTFSAGSTVHLTSSQTFSVNSSGTFTALGSSGSHITLDSTSSPTQAVLTINSGASQNVNWVDATDIDSSAGDTVAQIKGSISNTDNWELGYNYNFGATTLSLSPNSSSAFERVFVYSGAISLTLLPVGSIVVDNSYVGAIILQIVPSSSDVFDVNYTGNQILQITNFSSDVFDKSYTGSQTIEFLNSVSTVRDFSYVGNLALAFNVNSTSLYLETFSYSGAITFSLNLTSEYLDIQTLAGQITLALTPNASYSYEQVFSYSGSITLSLVLSSSNLFDKTYSGSISLVFLPSGSTNESNIFTYSASQAIQFINSSTVVIAFVYEANQVVSLIPSSSYLQQAIFTYSGNVSLSFVCDSLDVFDKIYTGSQSIVLNVSATTLLEAGDVYSGNITITFVSSYQRILDHGYSGSQTINLNCNSSNLFVKTYSGLSTFSLTPSSSYIFTNVIISKYKIIKLNSLINREIKLNSNLNKTVKLNSKV